MLPRSYSRACEVTSASAQRLTYVDSSAIVKLAVSEPESSSLRHYLSRKPLVTSARTEVARALLALGPEAVERGEQVLRRIQLLRVNDRVLIAAGKMTPAELRSLDAIHLASAHALGSGLRCVVTYDARLADAAEAIGCAVVSPT
jgi:predicted nucleic acid-binding protein